MSNSEVRIQLVNGSSLVSSTNFEELRQKLLDTDARWLDMPDDTNPDGTMILRVAHIVAVHRTSVES